MLMRRLRRFAERIFCRRRIPQITFEINNRGGSHRILINVMHGEILARTEIGVHGALAIRRHENEATRCRWAT